MNVYHVPLKHVVQAIVIIILSLFSLSGEADAIPSFARQYNLSCNSCHSPVPKLTPFGDAFASNGFQLKNLETTNPPAAIDDSTLTLMRELPISVRLDGFARIQPNIDQKTDIEWPFIMKLFSSGQIKEDISYFFYFLMNEGGNITGVEDAFLYFNDIGGQKFDITVGQFQVADMIFKRELRPTFEDYQIYETKPGLSKVDLTYDRGLILNYTLPSNTDLFLSVVNGNGIGSSNDGLYDSDPYKNFVGRISQQVNSSFSIGTLGYLGKEGSSQNNSTISMAGGDATLSFDKFEFLCQYIFRHDTNPFFLAGKDSTINSSGGFAQLTFAPQLTQSSWYAFILYNNVRSDIEELKYHSIATNFSYLISRNFKVSAEYAYDIERTKHAITLGFTTAF